MRSFEPSALLTAWTPSPFGLSLVAVAAGWYIRQVARARRDGIAWAWWRVALYLVLGVGTLAYAVCGPLATYRSQVFWIGALQVGSLASLVPVGLALGDPITLLRRLQTDRQHPIIRLLETPVARVLMFPAVSTVLAVGTLLLVFFTPVFVASTRSRAVEALLDVLLVGTGLLFVLPLMVDELLPAWATPGVRTLLAFADGLLDAVPGILLMTAGTVVARGYPGFSGHPGSPDPLLDTHLGGGALLAVAESVGLPIIGAVFVEWVRTDDREARALDALLDASLGTGQPSGARPETGSAVAIEAVEPGGEGHEGASGLWWETDPRFAGRFRRPHG